MGALALETSRHGIKQQWGNWYSTLGVRKMSYGSDGCITFIFGRSAAGITRNQLVQVGL